MIKVNYSPALTFKGIYEFRYNVARFGRMGIELQSEPGSYTMTSDIATTGLLKIFVPHTSHTTVDGKGSNFDYNRVIYESNYQTRKKAKYVNMVISDHKDFKETLVPPDNRATRPAVPEIEKTNAVDPLSALLRIRKELYETLSKGQTSFSLKIYDGRRLTLVKGTIHGRKTMPYGGTKADTIQVAFTRELLAGFTQSELEDHSSKEPPLYAYFSNDGRLIPIKLETHMWFGTVAAQLVKECRTGESCLLGLK